MIQSSQTQFITPTTYLCKEAQPDAWNRDFTAVLPLRTVGGFLHKVFKFSAILLTEHFCGNVRKENSLFTQRTYSITWLSVSSHLLQRVSEREQTLKQHGSTVSGVLSSLKKNSRVVGRSGSSMLITWWIKYCNVKCFFLVIGLDKSRPFSIYTLHYIIACYP